jgi:hypothetical protein
MGGVDKTPFLLYYSLRVRSFMSLISQRDREVAIEALDFYLFNKKFDLNEEKTMEINALINWIKLEYTKHEN